MNKPRRVCGFNNLAFSLPLSIILLSFLPKEFLQDPVDGPQGTESSTFQGFFSVFLNALSPLLVSLLLRGLLFLAVATTQVSDGEDLCGVNCFFERMASGGSLKEFLDQDNLRPLPFSVTKQK